MITYIIRPTSCSVALTTEQHRRLQHSVMTVFNITIYLDTICAWCYIGDRTLGRAITLYQRTYPGGRDDTFNFMFHPFYLRNKAPAQGVPLHDAMLEKNQTESRVVAIKTKMQRIGNEYGIKFNYDSKVGSTRLSHVLIQQTGRSKGNEVQKLLVEALYAMHYEHGGDITSADELVAVAKGVGIGAQEARDWLADEQVGRKVDAMARMAREEKGVTSVPTLEIGEVRIEGADDVGGLLEALVKVKEGEKARTD